MGMNMQHGHGHEHKPWTWTHSWTWRCTLTRTCRIDIDMGTDMERDYYWIDTIGRNYAKVRNYLYIDIVRVSMGSREITTFRNYTQFLIKITYGTVEYKTGLFCFHWSRLWPINNISAILISNKEKQCCACGSDI
jgi:hypothetical protein